MEVGMRKRTKLDLVYQHYYSEIRKKKVNRKNYVFCNNSEKRKLLSTDKKFEITFSTYKSKE